MTDPLTPGEIVARAAGYPYPAPLRSFVQEGDHVHELREAPDLDGRSPLLVYGANGSPQILARTLAPLADVPLPVLRARLADFDVVFSAHISPSGSVPSTLQRSPGTLAPVFVAYPTPEQEQLLVEAEPNYELREAAGLGVQLDGGEEVEVLDLLVSRHGCLALDGDCAALAAIESAGRTFPALGEVEVLEHVRHLVAPEQDLERFVESSLDPGLAAALRGNAIPLEL